MIDIRTGDRDWDAAFALSQNAAFELLFPPNEHLPNSSIVSVRGPDHGYSPKGDGTDYPASWNGQTPFEAYYLDSVLPVSSAAFELFRNFLALQDEEGIDRWKTITLGPARKIPRCADPGQPGLEILRKVGRSQIHYPIFPTAPEIFLGLVFTRL